MDVSQPLVIAAAFVAGLGFMITVRFIWVILKHSIQLLLVAGVLFALISGINEGEDSAWSAIQSRLTEGKELASGVAAQARGWIGDHEVQLNLVPKERSKS